MSVVVKRSRLPPPSANCQKMFSGPPLFDVNAIRLPSGVHVGYMLTLPSNVRRENVSRDGS